MGELQQREIHEVRDEEWIDFVEQKLDHQALLRGLEVSSPSILAVSNICYSKTIFEGHVIDSLDQGLEDNGLDWLLSVVK